MEIEEQIRAAVDILKSGGTVIYPTETVYGLGADALSEEAVRKVYELKRRDFSQPVSLAVSSFEMLREVAYVDANYLSILAELLPGPVTVLLRKKEIVPDLLTAGSNIIGIRFPDNEIATRLIREAGPITSTSANISLHKPPICIEEVEIKADIIINGGKCKYSMPSTVVDMVNEEKIEIKREGACYDRILHVLRGKASGKGLRSFSMP